MARATRNSTNGVSEKKADIENETPSEPSLPPKSLKGALNKKRKREFVIEPADIPSSKLSRSDDNEEIPTMDEKADSKETSDSRFPAFAGEMPLNDDDATKILDILDVADEQGLLDRVFPLDNVLGTIPSSVPSSSKAPSDSYSLRMLLRESSQHPLRVLKSAIRQLYPISSLPRSRASPPAQQQRRFCELALSLIDQASKNTLDGLALSPEIVLPEYKPKMDEEDEDSMVQRRKYALVQRLPTGDLWTSLNTEHVGSDSKLLVDCEAGYAELVAVLPTASSSKPSLPTLGDLHSSKPVSSRVKHLTSQRISCGTFLDYGPYASFAPSFDSDSGDVGYNGVSSVLWRRHEKGKAREKARILGERMRQKIAQQASESMEVDGVEEVDSAEAKEKERARQYEAMRASVEKVFGEEEAPEVLSIFDALEHEENVTELVNKTGEAIQRLAALQEERFLNTKAIGAIDSTERELAAKIMDSLALLASLRPRSSADPEVSIIPPVSSLRVLQRCLPSESTPGWHGTLSDDRPFAMRDDMTVNVQSVPTPVTAQVPATPAANNAAPPATPSFTSYNFANFPQNYRTTYSSQPGQYNQTSTTPVAQRTQNTFQQTPYAQQAQAYAQWLMQNQGSVSQAGTPARYGTPQPNINQSATFFPYGTQAGQMVAGTSTPTRAVANTLVGKLQAAVGMGQSPQAAGGTGMNNGLALPAHMRPQAGSPLAFGAYP